MCQDRGDFFFEIVFVDTDLHALVAIGVSPYLVSLFELNTIEVEWILETEGFNQVNHVVQPPIKSIIGVWWSLDR